jgi:hypothetical protein
MIAKVLKACISNLCRFLHAIHPAHLVYDLLLISDAFFLQAEEEHIKEFGSPSFWSPGTCPADFKYLHYGQAADSLCSDVLHSKLSMLDCTHIGKNHNASPHILHLMTTDVVVLFWVVCAKWPPS